MFDSAATQKLFPFPGGYYTIEQTKSRLRIIVLNTNFMRQEHTKLTPSHSAAIRQRPSNPTDSSEHTNYYYHHRNYYHGSNNGYYSAVPAMDTGGQTRALSAAESHESQRQWEWLESVLAKSQTNKETVSLFKIDVLFLHVELPKKTASFCLPDDHFGS